MQLDEFFISACNFNKKMSFIFLFLNYTVVYHNFMELCDI